MRALTEASVAKAKIGVGIPFYARRWTGTTAPLQKGGKQVGWLPYRTLTTDHQRWQDAYRRWDATYSADYLSIGPMNEFISFNGPHAIQATVSWAKAQGFGGVFAFTTEYEYFADAAGEARYPLSTVLYNAVRDVTHVGEPLPASRSAAAFWVVSRSAGTVGTLIPVARTGAREA